MYHWGSVTCKFCHQLLYVFSVHGRHWALLPIKFLNGPRMPKRDRNLAPFVNWSPTIMKLKSFAFNKWNKRYWLPDEAYNHYWIKRSRSKNAIFVYIKYTEKDTCGHVWQSFCKQTKNKYSILGFSWNHLIRIKCRLLTHFSLWNKCN